MPLTLMPPWISYFEKALTFHLSPSTNFRKSRRSWSGKNLGAAERPECFSQEGRGMAEGTLYTGKLLRLCNALGIDPQRCSVRYTMK